SVEFGQIHFFLISEKQLVRYTEFVRSLFRKIVQSNVWFIFSVINLVQTVKKPAVDKWNSARNQGEKSLWLIEQIGVTIEVSDASIPVPGPRIFLPPITLVTFLVKRSEEEILEKTPVICSGTW